PSARVCKEIPPEPEWTMKAHFGAQDSSVVRSEGKGNLVFVTVGNATQGFFRLLEVVDSLAGEGFFKGEAVLIQSGNSMDFRAIHCKQQAFLPPDLFAQLIWEAKIVVCHGGAGTLYHVFRAGKVPVVMPRRKKYGEHVEDQLELVKALARENRIIPAYE